MNNYKKVSIPIKTQKQLIHNLEMLWINRPAKNRAEFTQDKFDYANKVYQNKITEFVENYFTNRRK